MPVPIYDAPRPTTFEPVRPSSTTPNTVGIEASSTSSCVSKQSQGHMPVEPHLMCACRIVHQQHCPTCHIYGYHVAAKSHCLGIWKRHQSWNVTISTTRFQTTYWSRVEDLDKENLDPLPTDVTNTTINQINTKLQASDSSFLAFS